MRKFQKENSNKNERNNDLIRTGYDIDPIAKRLECLLSDVNVHILQRTVHSVAWLRTIYVQCATCIRTLNQAFSKINHPFGLFWFGINIEIETP